MRKVTLVCLSLLLCVSCFDKHNVKTLLRQFKESVIDIPEDMLCIKNGAIVPFHLDSFKKNKFIVYYDSLSCSSCRVSHLTELDSLYLQSDSSSFSVITIFSPPLIDVGETCSNLILSKNPFPVYLDYNKSFARANKCIPNDNRFKCFLIDSLNHPVFVGDPLANRKIAELFQRVISLTN